MLRAPARLIVGAMLIAGSILAGPGDKTSLDWAVVTIGGVSRGAVVDSGGFTSVSYVDAIAMGLLDSTGNPKTTPTGTETVNGVTCDAFSVPLGYKPATALNGHVKGNGDTNTTTTTVYVPQKGADNKDSIPTKLGRDIVGVEINGKRLVPWDFGADPAGSGKNIRGSKYASAAPLPSDIVFPLQTGSILTGVVVNGVTVSADLTFLPTTMLSPAFAQEIGFTATDTLTLPSDLQQSLFTDGYISEPLGTSVTLASGFLDFVLPSTAGSYTVDEVAVAVNPELGTDLVLGSDALIPPDHGGYIDNDSFRIVSDVPEPSSLLLVAISLAGILWRIHRCTPGPVHRDRRVRNNSLFRSAPRSRGKRHCKVATEVPTDVRR